MTRFFNGPDYRHLLVDMLEQDCPPDHEVVIYRGATQPIPQPRICRVALRELSATDATAEETVILCPASSLRPNQVLREQSALLARDKVAQTQTS